MILREIRLWRYKLWWCLFCTNVPVIIMAQDSGTFKKDTAGIHRAIYWTKKGQHEKAKQICRSILQKDPHNVDAEVLVGRLYSWDKQFDSSRIFLKGALKDQPSNEDALNAIINLELWSNHTDQAMIYSNKALLLYPNSESLLIKKAKVLNKQQNFNEALKIIERVLQINPNNHEALQFKEYLKKRHEGNEKNGIGLSYINDHFSNTYSPWNYASLYYYHKGKSGTVLANLNYANRFQISGLQYELSFYPKISKSTSAYIGGAYSASVIFPNYNLGAGLYHKIFKKTEAEIGARYLHFLGLDNPIIIYTGALSFTLKKLWVSARTYITPQAAGINKSYYFTTKYYLNNPKNNITLTLNTGRSPYDYTDPVSGKSFNLPINTKRAKLSYQTVFLSQKNILKLSSAYEKRNYYNNYSRSRISLGVGLERLF